MFRSQDPVPSSTTHFPHFANEEDALDSICFSFHFGGGDEGKREIKARSWGGCNHFDGIKTHICFGISRMFWRTAAGGAAEGEPEKPTRNCMKAEKCEAIKICYNAWLRYERNYKGNAFSRIAVCCSFPCVWESVFLCVCGRAKPQFPQLNKNANLSRWQWRRMVDLEWSGVMGGRNECWVSLWFAWIICICRWSCRGDEVAHPLLLPHTRTPPNTHTVSGTQRVVNVFWFQARQ